MRIISYNVNGIRAAIRKGFYEWLEGENPDVICIQETKANPEQVNLEPLKLIGYKDYWFSAQKKGYSGVAIFTKKAPLHVKYGTGIKTMDFEGRNIRLDFKDFSVMSMYLPSASNMNRLEFKMNYMEELLKYLTNLRRTIPNLIVCGDYNICHKAIDIHDPVRNKNVSGFLPEEREWLDRFVASGFVDSFREYNQNPYQYSWWSYRANSRANNKGWRLDYGMITHAMQGNLKNARILQDVVHSDHCPISLQIEGLF